MNMGNIMPGMSPQFWLAMGRLGRTDWLDIVNQGADATGRGRSSFIIRKEAIRHLNEADLTLTGLCTHNHPHGGVSYPHERRDGLTGMHLVTVETIASLTANGPKVFKPTTEQCEAMEQVEINIPIPDYHQPYPAMMVEFPTEYRLMIAKRYGYQKECPRYLFVRHYAETNAVFTCATFSATQEDLIYFFQARPEFPTVEHALRTHVDQIESEENLSETMTRVAMNLMLLLSGHPTRLVPTNGAFLAKTKEWQKRKRTDANEVEIKTHVYEMALEQEITVRRQVTREQAMKEGTPDEQARTHASPRPHWRKGHWRREAGFAAKLAAGLEIKRIFIRPVFVMAEQFVGDRSGASAVYSAR